jgi:hypothetical protein
MPSACAVKGANATVKPAAARLKRRSHRESE